MENVGSVGPARYVNDSKATNANAAAQALKSYDNIFWIAGGEAKDGGIDDLSPHFKNIKRAYLIGEAAKDFDSTLKSHKIPCKISGELRMAILCATKDALAAKTPNPVILLSPACASFDQFENFEVRGDAFRELALEIVSLYQRESNNAA
jgi:UDP-N-acetylmuramoylalanine--D-glutamate ligase